MESTEIFKKCFEEEACTPKILRKKYCRKVSGCVRILLENSKFKIELSVFGHSITYDLYETCYPVYEKGIGRIKVCADKVEIFNGRLKKVTLKVQLCLGVVIPIPIYGDYDLEKCWDVYGADISFFKIDSSDFTEDMLIAAKNTEQSYLYVEEPILSTVVTRQELIDKIGAAENIINPDLKKCLIQALDVAFESGEFDEQKYTIAVIACMQGDNKLEPVVTGALISLVSLLIGYFLGKNQK